jgi:hypothetical protein
VSQIKLPTLLLLSNVHLSEHIPSNGAEDGKEDGKGVGAGVGTLLGAAVGCLEGLAVGKGLGSALGFLGSWAFLKAGVSPAAAFEDELDEKPVAFGRYEGATGSAEAAFPCIYYVLHFVNKIRCV